MISLLLNRLSSTSMGIFKTIQETHFRIGIAYLPKTRWRTPPSLIPKIGCHFVIIEPIVFKFDGYVGNYTRNTISELKVRIYPQSRWQTPPSSISKIGCHFIIIEPIVFKFDGFVGNHTRNTTSELKARIYLKSRWRTPPS